MSEEIYVVSTEYEYYVPFVEFCEIEKAAINKTIMRDYPDLFDSEPRQTVTLFTIYSTKHPNYQRLLQHFKDIQNQPTITIVGNREYSLTTGKRLGGINISYVAERENVTHKNICTKSKIVVVAKPQVFVHEQKESSSEEENST